MKAILYFISLFLISGITSFAQGRISIAPTYWFNYNPYSYQVNFTNGLGQYQAFGHGLISSFGVTLRYHFTSQWNVSLGALYYRNANRARNSTTPPSLHDDPPFISEGGQIPLLVSYRLTSSRLSPYFSVGAVLTKSKTLTARPLTTDGVLGVGIDYQFGTHLSLLLQPTASYSFYKPASYLFYQVTNYRSYNLGLQAQLIWHL